VQLEGTVIGDLPVARLAKILPFFFVTHCSASPDAGMLKGIEKINFESEGDGQPEILRKIGETSEDAKSDSKTPTESKPQTPAKSSEEAATASTSATQDKSQQTPNPPQPVAPPQNQLPEIKIESDKALLPIASTSAQGIPPVVLPWQDLPVIDSYSYVGESSDANYALKCSTMRLGRGSNDKPYYIVCSLADGSMSRLSVDPTEMVWSVSVTKCPKATITGNVMTPGCMTMGDVSQCPEFVPAAKVNLRDVNLAQCVEDRSQLVFTIRSIATGVRTTMTMTLTTSTDENLLRQPITKR
jgi:hypothetical protein